MVRKEKPRMHCYRCYVLDCRYRVAAIKLIECANDLAGCGKTILAGLRRKIDSFDEASAQ